MRVEAKFKIGQKVIVAFIVAVKDSTARYAQVIGPMTVKSVEMTSNKLSFPTGQPDPCAWDVGFLYQFHETGDSKYSEQYCFDNLPEAMGSVDKTLSVSARKGLSEGE